MVAVLDWQEFTEAQWNTFSENEWSVFADAASSLLVALESLEDLLANCISFQVRLGVASAVEAKERIHFDLFEDTERLLAAERPFAIIKEESWQHAQIGQGAGIELDADGAILVMLTDNARHQSDHKESKREFARWAARVFDEMAEGSGVDGNFPFTSRTLHTAPQRTPREARGQGHDLWEIASLFRYGE